MQDSKNIIVACAGWTIAKEHAHLFPNSGTHLERYARLFSAVEINSTFYRLPKAETVVKWKNLTPPGFLFSVKLTREITHLRRLKDVSMLPVFLERMSLLEEKHGPLLVQLPPSLVYEERVADSFFKALRSLFAEAVVLEPRHPTWFSGEATALLKNFQVARVAADPMPHPSAAEPAAWPGIAYFRLHGSPRMYYSAYSENYLETLTRRLLEKAAGAPVWCIFDNTASGAAVENGLWVKEKLKKVAQTSELTVSG